MSKNIVVEAGSATISNSAKAISHADFSWTTGNLGLADLVYITTADQPVMLLFDGSAPTTTFGIYLAAQTLYELAGNANIQALQFIRAGGTDAELTAILMRGRPAV